MSDTDAEVRRPLSPSPTIQDDDLQDGALVDEAAHDSTFDVAEIPSQLISPDAHDQEEVHFALYRSQHVRANQDYTQKFKAASEKPIRFSTLQTLHGNDDVKRAISLLSSRRRLVIDNRFLVDTSHPDHLTRVGPHHLDYTLYIGARRGLDAALPNVESMHTWTASIQLYSTHRLWPDKNAKDLPFNPVGRMLYIGTRLDDQLWLALLPEAYFNVDDPNNTHNRLPILPASSSALSTQHALMLIMFMAHVLEDMRFQDISCIDTYPDPLTWQSVRASTEILGRLQERCRTISLHLDQFRDFHEGIRDLWHDWVNNAPESWKEDNFLTQNQPVGITLRYGQDQPIMHSEDLAIEHRNWDEDRNYEYIRQFNFSCATHISYLIVDEWDEVPNEVIQRNHRTLYDRSDDNENRLEVNLEDVPLLDEDGHEVNVFNSSGFRIPRRLPASHQACGALLNLERVHELFQSEEDAHGHVRNVAPFVAYPLAFTRTFGNVTCNSIMPSFDCRLRDIDDRMRPVIPDDAEDTDAHDDEYDDDDRSRRRGAPVLQPLRMQAYNNLSHRVRDQTKFHYVQLGIVTSALAGSAAKSASGQYHWHRRLDFCKESLPHKRFETKVSGDGQPQSLRFENTYTLDVYRMADHHRNGWAWSHPSVLGPIKDVLVVFQPDFVPKLFKFVTFPITALIETFWKSHIEDLDQGKVVEPCTIEFVSMLERTLNYAHTGNAAVLTKKLMDRAWLSLGLLIDGFPALSDAFIAHNALFAGQIAVRQDYWPVDRSTRRPLTSSQRCQELTYGPEYFEAYIARFTIHLAMKNIPQDAYEDIPNTLGRLACYAFDVAMGVYFNDVKNLVHANVTPILNPLVDDDDPIISESARDRLTALSTWMDEEFPLSYTPTVLANLLQAISEPRDKQFEFTESALGCQPVSFLADLIIKQCGRFDNRRKPPFIQGGKFLSVCRIAVEEIRLYAAAKGLTDVQVERLISDAIITVAERRKINHIPWSRNQAGNGRPSNIVVHDVWLNLGAKKNPISSSVPSFLTVQQSNNALALQASQVIQAADSRGDWSALAVTLKSFHTVLHKVNPPSEWDIQHCSGSGRKVPEYIKNVYSDVKKSFNGTKPLHQLALICGIVCAGLIPDIFSPPLERYPSDPSGYDTYVRGLDWVRRPKWKGVSIRAPFITMVTTFILAHMEDNVVLQNEEDLHIWTKKHTAKGITVFLLCRLGLAIPVTPSAFAASKWKTDIQPLPTADIERKHAEVVRLLTSKGEYGGYDAVRYLMGYKAADILGTRHFVYPRAISAPSNTPSSSKRTRDDNDDHIAACAAPVKSRKVSGR